MGRTRRAARATALAAVCVVAPAGAQADDVPGAPRDTLIVESPGVTISAPRARATPGGASAVEAPLDSARARAAPTLEDQLRAMPLVVIRANSRGEAQPALRGADDRQIAVLVDGVPITLGWDHRTDLAIVPLSAATRVTLTRGLSSLLLGPNVLGGAVQVNIARERDPNPPSPLAVDAGIEPAGGRSLAVSGGAISPDGSGRWVARAGAGFRRRDGLPLARALEGGDAAARARTGDGDVRLNSDVEGFDGFVAMRREWRSGTWMSLAGSGYRLERGVPPETHVDEPRLWRYPFQARGLAALSAGSGMRRTPWGRGDLEASFGLDAGRTEIDTYDDLGYRTVSGGEDDDDRTWIARLLGDHTLGPRADLRTAATFADVRHQEVLDPGGAGRYRQRLWSLATEADVRAGRATPVRLSAGVSADGSDTPESADKPALDRLWAWGARAGGTVALGHGAVLVHASASRRVRFPSLRELYSGSLGRFLPNPGLAPEIVWIGEGGMTARRGGLEAQVVGFHQRLEDAIVRSTVATPTGTRFQRVNQDAVRARGVEALVRAAWRRLEASADVTLQRVRAVDGDGDESRIEYEPGASGSVAIDVGFPAGLHAGAAVRMLGRQFGIDSDAGALEAIAPSARWDLRVGRTTRFDGNGPWRHLDVVLAIENLTDRAIFDQLGLPQPGRTVRMQVALR